MVLPPMLGYYVHDLSPFIMQFTDTFGLRWYGMAYLTAFLLGIVLLRYFSRRGLCDIPEKDVMDFIIGGAIFGVVLGGRLGYMLFYDLQAFLANPLIIVRLMDGGMSAHGGIIGLSLYTWWYVHRHKYSWFNVGDNLVVAAPLGLCLGRIANFINGELYGRVTSVAWAVQFPSELQRAPQETVEAAVQGATAIDPAWNSVDAIIVASRSSEPLREVLGGVLSPRHPSQIYEAVLEGAVLFLILFLLRTRCRLPNGVLTGVFFIGYAIMRSFSELFREPDAPLTGALTRGQFLSIFLVLLGTVFLIVSWRRKIYPRRQPA